MASLRLRTGETVQVDMTDVIGVLIDTLKGLEATTNPVARMVAQSVAQEGEGQLIACLRECLRELGGGGNGAANGGARALEG
ncbi:MAG: hypothetical protein ACOX4G_01855 [Limnochordia bacterium]|jgi:hypothetical protein